ncbi:MAG: hypothetical protein FWD19_05535 [Defluviitaleaceae bacterium]|nr:hypothetical protein [Defluviitaleaceae bacterium]
MFEKKIENKNLRKLGRAADMLWLSIGEPIMIDWYKGGKREVSEYAIHFQCPWRFVKNGEILLAAHDIYNPFNENAGKDWEWDIFGREKEESSIFDVRSQELSELLPLKIKSVNSTDTSDLHIDFENGICFDTFMAHSRKSEFFRFLDNTSDEQIVIFDVD